MKRFLLMLCLLIAFLKPLQSQDPFVGCYYNFEDNPCEEASYLSLIIPDSDSIWQVCTPAKTIFNSAFSIPRAILTDSTGHYPANVTSSFILKVVPYENCMCAPVIGGYYKFDSDSLKDYGRVEFSLDYGTTWLDALSETVIPDPYWQTPKPVFTGRIHEWKEFLAFIPDFKWGDTLYYRFTFISDNIETNQDGWMLDDLAMIEHTEGAEDPGSGNGINIYPNPADNRITVSVNDFTRDTDIAVYDTQCKLQLKETMHKEKEEVDISGLDKGMYIISVINGDNYKVKAFVKE